MARRHGGAESTEANRAALDDDAGAKALLRIRLKNRMIVLHRAARPTNTLSRLDSSDY